MGRIFSLISFSQKTIKKTIIKEIFSRVNWWLSRKDIEFVKISTMNNGEIEYNLIKKEEIESIKENILQGQNQAIFLGVYSLKEKETKSFGNVFSDSLLFTNNGLANAQAFENEVNKIAMQSQSAYEFVENIDTLDANYSLTTILPDGAIIAKRDVFGIKPLWYAKKKGDFIAISSERKMLFNLININEINPLSPRDALIFKNNALKIVKECTPIIYDYPSNEIPESELFEEIHSRLVASLKKRIPKKEKIAVLFSGGVDSTVLAKLLLELNVDVIGITVGFEKAKDLEKSIEVAKDIDLPLEYKKITINDIKDVEEKVVFATEEYNPIRVSVGITLYLASKFANDLGRNYIFSGTGSEEIFAGYQKYLELINLGIEFVHYATLDGLRNVWIRDLYRDDTVAFYSNVTGLLPYLDRDLVDYSMKINPKYKVSENEKKVVFRKYAEWIGIPHEVAWRPKLAAQYGSGITQNLRKYIRTKGYQHIIDWLFDVYKKKFYIGDYFD
ncbi:MAG: asparagine synthase-related protein [Candidatus Asgardarchaeia archaeon]